MLSSSGLADRLTECLRDWLADGLTDWRTDGLTDWRTDGLTDCRTDGLTDGRTDGRTNGLTDWRTGCRRDWLTDWLTDDWLTDWRTDRRTDGLTDWLTDWLTNRPASWLSNLANYFVDCSTKRGRKEPVNEWKIFAEGPYHSTFLPKVDLVVMGEKENWHPRVEKNTTSYISILQMDKVHKGVTPGYVRTDVLGFK